MCLKYSLHGRPDLEKCWCLVGIRENSVSLAHLTFLVDCSSGRKELLNTWPDSKLDGRPLRAFPSRLRMETYVTFCSDGPIYSPWTVQSKASKQGMSCIPAHVSASPRPGTGESAEAPEPIRSKAPVSMLQQGLWSCAKSDAALWGGDSRALQRAAWCSVKRFLRGLAMCVFGQAD
nr:steroid receptor-associated and regulated protein [Pelodiscus sinensis]|eukprot:XP_025035768.1 steroid receptor-associated and regulated protein [Pelodiscus sinensis]